MKIADINISVFKENDDIHSIQWSASESASVNQKHEAKAMVLALWDAQQRNSLRVDLWTHDMSIHDMNDFIFQTLLSLADTYKNATQNAELVADMKQFARDFAEQAAAIEEKYSSALNFQKT